MILDENSSSWTATEVDPQATSDLTVLDSAAPIVIPGSPPEEPGRFGRLSAVRSARLLGQVSVVLAASIVAGLLVFLLVRAVAGSDGSDGSDGEDGSEEAVDDRSVVEPGPAAIDGAPPNSSRSGTRRSVSDGNSSSGAIVSSSGDERAVSAATVIVTGSVDDGEADAGLDEDGDKAGTAEASDDESASSTSIGPSTTSVSSTTDRSTTDPTTATTDPIGPTTNPMPATTEPSSSSTAAPTSQPATSVFVPPSTTAAPTTTVATTTAPPLPSQLLTAPTEGSAQSWDTTTRFRANSVPGAFSYCWTVVAGDQAGRCGADRSFDLGANELDPGPATAKAEAFNADGKLVMSQQISFTLLATDFLDNPDNGDRFNRFGRLRLRSDEVPTATNYCWLLTSDGYSSGAICDRDRRVNLPSGGDIRRGLGYGAVKIEATAYRGSTLIGRHIVNITIE
ncbi:MAG: hypothetical protein ACR2QK_24390 [Acidimicrobiales bacterium]